MKIIRLYTGADGKSHFQDMDIPLKMGDAGEVRTDRLPATGIVFRETGAQFALGYHNAPARQYVITLEGQGEIEVGDGTKRQFGPGDIMLAEDISGQGHITRALNNRPRKSIFVTLD
jgi:hypothetical protein